MSAHRLAIAIAGAALWALCSFGLAIWGLTEGRYWYATASAVVGVVAAVLFNHNLRSRSRVS